MQPEKITPPENLVKYCEYMRNISSGVMSIKIFDDDWEPAGPLIREQMRKAHLIEEWGGGMALRLEVDI
jgi:hypothetical protein